MKTYLDFLRNASPATLAKNPHLSLAKAKKTNSGPSSSQGRGIMNKTESEFGVYLEALKRSGEILRYEFEGITLRWADMRYTPDFVVFLNFPDTPDFPRIKLIEVKGAHIWDRDIVRFKGARAYWPEFQFEMHQKTKSGWKRKY